MEERTCSEPGCDRNGKLVRGMCPKHYRYWLDHTPAEERPTAPRFVDDFWTHVRKSHEHGCWTWTNKTDPKGYGRWRKVLAHRESWRRANGDIPGGLWVLHHCDNPPCVNPAHLYLGTVVENVRDMIDRGHHYVPPRMTHCSRGHELSGENVRVSGRHRKRMCRTCDNERSARRQDRVRRERGVPEANRVSAQERALIIELCASDLTRKAVAKQVGRGIATVHRILRENRVADV